MNVLFIISVRRESKGVPYKNIKLLNGKLLIPDYYEYNGAIYVINVKSLKEKGIGNFTRKVKYIMSALNSVDIDDESDWLLAEMIAK